MPFCLFFLESQYEQSELVFFLNKQSQFMSYSKYGGKIQVKYVDVIFFWCCHNLNCSQIVILHPIMAYSRSTVGHDPIYFISTQVVRNIWKIMLVWFWGHFLNISEDMSTYLKHNGFFICIFFVHSHFVHFFNGPERLKNSLYYSNTF